jgi:hypothetical protein
MFLQTILFIQLFLTFFIIFFIKTFLSNKRYFIIFLLSYLLVNFFIVGLFISNMFHLTVYNPNLEYHIFIHKEKVWGLTLIIKNSFRSYLCLWYNPTIILEKKALVFVFYAKQGAWHYYIFFTCILLFSSIHKCFLFFDYFFKDIIDNKISFPLSIRDNFEFIFFVKYSFLFEFLITAFYFVRILYVVPPFSF